MSQAAAAAPVDPLNQALSRGAIMGILFIAAIVIIGMIVADSSGGSSGVFSLFEDNYKVQMPDGAIKTMSESELETTNKQLIKERNEQVEKIRSYMDKSAKDLQRELDKLKASSRSR